MHRVLGGVLALLLAWPLLQAQEKPKEPPASPAEQYQTLLKDFAKAQSDFFKAYQEAGSAEEKAKLLKEKYPDFAPQFLELAEKNPKDPVALDALVWVTANRSPAAAGGKGKSTAKALEILLKDHLQSDKLGPVCERLAFQGTEETSKAFLLAVLDKSPHKTVQAEACLALAQMLQRRAEFIDEMKKDPATVEQLTNALGKEYVEALRKDDSAKLSADSEKYYRQFGDKYIGEVTPQRLTNLARSMSFSSDKGSEAVLRNLVEKDTRPEVQGPATLYLAKVLSRRADSLPEAEAKEAAKLHKESEDLLEQASTKYADVKLDFQGTVGKKAKSELYSLRNLSVGKVAPSVEAEDQDGKKFKLSDYRGKVVLLDFWSEF